MRIILVCAVLLVSHLITLCLGVITGTAIASGNKHSKEDENNER